MKKAFFMILAGLCLATSGMSQFNTKNLSLNTGWAEADGNYERLRIYPIYANEEFLKAHQNFANYVSLRQAMAAKKVIITETDQTAPPAGSGSAVATGTSTGGDSIAVQTQDTAQEFVQSVRVVSSSARVNTLYAENTGKDTVYILAGEVIAGGKQNRMVAEDVVLAPNSGRVEIPVFCVEKNRWTYENGTVNVTTGGTPASVKEDFSSSGYISAQQVRKAAVVERKQAAVWESVDVITSANGASSSTGSYTELENSKSYQKQRKQYLQHFRTLPGMGENLVGMLAVSGDKVIGCDIFANPVMFEQQYEGLLDAFIAQALTDGDKVKIKKGEAEEYFDYYYEDENEQKQRVKRNGSEGIKGARAYRMSTF